MGCLVVDDVVVVALRNDVEILGCDAAAIRLAGSEDKAYRGLSLMLGMTSQGTSMEVSQCTLQS